MTRVIKYIPHGTQDTRVWYAYIVYLSKIK